jgi:uncharacterized membrane protein YGL010W
MISLFRSAPELMVQYAHYHRDRRNILTHLVGIPLIVLSIGMLLSLISFDIAGNTITLAACCGCYLQRGISRVAIGCLAWLPAWSMAH